MLPTIAFLFAGCLPTLPATATIASQYRSALVQIDRPKETKERYGSVVAIKPESDNKYAYEDGLFLGIFYVIDSRIHFILKNKTEHSIKIVWDEAAFIDIDGQSDRVVHTGVKYADRNASQPPSVIPGQRSLTDFVVPAKSIYYREGYYGTYYSSPGGWEELGIVLPTSDKVAADRYGVADSLAVEAFISKVKDNIGKRFGFLLPLEIEGVVNEYTFWFEVQDASVYK